MKRAIGFVVVLLLAVPVTLVVTIMLSPFWNWFEARSGIESIGHSGPANWCFAVVFVIAGCLGWGGWFWIWRKKD
jgi:hypothetical protein